MIPDYRAGGRLDAELIVMPTRGHDGLLDAADGQHDRAGAPRRPGGRCWPCRWTEPAPPRPPGSAAFWISRSVCRAMVSSSSVGTTRPRARSPAWSAWRRPRRWRRRGLERRASAVGRPPGTNLGAVLADARGEHQAIDPAHGGRQGSGLARDAIHQIVEGERRRARSLARRSRMSLLTPERPFRPPSW